MEPKNSHSPPLPVRHATTPEPALPNLLPPKAFLLQQAYIPEFALANSPLSALGEGVTRLLASVAGALPEVAGAPVPAAVQGGFRNVFKSLEAELPDQPNPPEDEDGGWGAREARQSLEGWLTEWLRGKGRAWRPRTTEGYKSLCARHIIPVLGKVALADLTPRHIVHLYRQLGESGLARTSQAHVHAVLSLSLWDAVQEGLIPENPTDRVEAPRLSREVAVYVPPAGDVRKVLESARGDELHPLLDLAAHTGLRPSELVALRWRHFYPERRLVAVECSLQHRGGRWIEGAPKTKRGKRQVELPATTVGVLIEHGHREEERGRGRPDDFIFCRPDGGPLDPGTLSRRLRRLCQRAGIRPFTAYALRHLAASLAFAAGVNPLEVSARHGHASPGFTLERYGHLLSPNQGAAVAALEAALGGAIRTHGRRFMKPLLYH